MGALEGESAREPVERAASWPSPRALGGAQDCPCIRRSNTYSGAGGAIDSQSGRSTGASSLAGRPRASETGGVWAGSAIRVSMRCTEEASLIKVTMRVMSVTEECAGTAIWRADVSSGPSLCRQFQLIRSRGRTFTRVRTLPDKCHKAWQLELWPGRIRRFRGENRELNLRRITRKCV